MKKNRYILTFLFFIALIVSCKKDHIAYENDFDKSQKSWIDFKISSDNSYRYQVINSSWSGHTTETLITVKDGEVVGRSYTLKKFTPPSTTPTVVEEWIEEESQLNTHQTGSPIFTLEEIYQKAQSDWLLKRKNAKSYFEAKNGGLISSCGYVENGCMDDCFVGIKIAYIEKL
jgi:hypothetical protein